MRQPKTKSLILASLLALAASAALAQADNGSAGSPAANFDAGVSGRTSGLISGGGAASSSLDAEISASPRPKASNARPGVEAQARADRDTGARVKASKPPVSAGASNRASGFTSFGARSYRNTREP
jgi:hypothetical protein